MTDLTPYRAEIDEALRSLNRSGIGIDAREGFRAELSAAGFTPPSMIELGRLYRIKAPGDKGVKKSGWCILHEIPMQGDESQAIGVGAYASWRDGPEKVTWSSKDSRLMTQAEAAHYHQALEEAKAHREQELTRVQNEAAERAYAIWEAADEVQGAHAYLERKGLSTVPDGVKVSRGSLVIPICHGDSLASLQFIKPDGEKKMLLGGKAKGCYFRIDGDPDFVVVCEGFSTGMSIHLATGATVYICFMASNLYEVAAYAKAQHPNARNVIAGDDDRNNARGNAGRTKATQAADALAIQCVFPEDINGTDFNDLHTERGLDAVKEAFSQAAKIWKKKSRRSADESIFRPGGMLGSIVDYYNATSGNHQPGFAVQCALATASVICARYYTSNAKNRSSLYFINIAESGTGKQHAKNVMEEILDAAGLDSLVGGDGYTSGAAVLSALQDRPRHITVIDEFSKYLRMANSKFSSGMLAEANKKLMESFTSLDGKMRPYNYANTGVAKEKRKGNVSSVVNPAITLLAMTTPDDFFENVGVAQVKDGFLNRFLICISDTPRSLRVTREHIDVPDNIITWAKLIDARHGNKGDDFSTKPQMTMLQYTTEAEDAQREIDEYELDLYAKLKKKSLHEMTTRLGEIVRRVSLIAALSRDPMAETIEVEDVQWAGAYVKHNFEILIERIKMCMASSEFEGWKMECLQALRSAGENGIAEREIIQK